MLMGMFDVDRSGTIGFNGECDCSPMASLGSIAAEFAGLWKYVADWQGASSSSDSQYLIINISNRCSGSTTAITLEQSRAVNFKMPFVALVST
jgi:hypothetical protein